jgi:hypothetical protein
MLGLPALLWLSSCSGGSKDDAAANGNGNANAGGSAGVADLPDDEQQMPNLDIGSGGAPVVPPLDIADPCLSEVREAERVNVDLFVMLDRSSSMYAFTGDGTTEVTKWDAVTAALKQFLAAPESSQVGMGLRVFPQLQQDAPSACFSNDDCDTFGPCILVGFCPGTGLQCLAGDACPNPGLPTRNGYCENDDRYACTVGQPCGRNLGDCIKVECLTGTCSGDTSYSCLVGEDSCVDADGNSLGTCSQVDSGICQLADSCTLGDYSTPDVPITLGADRNDALTTALDATTPVGRTPTTVALQGAIEYATSWGQAHPDRVASVVLATDGLPTECPDAPSDAEAVAGVLPIAQAGMSQMPPVRTYVIGVFSEQEDQEQGASAALAAMAEAGGTDQAFLVSTNGNVTDDFLAALQAIGSSAISCEFLLPDDGDLDYGAVNLLLTQSDGTEVQLANVGSPDGCATGGDTGWYYLNEPDTGVPYQISVCPAVCQQFSNVTNGRVDLQIGCETILR